MESNNEIIIYQSEDGAIKLDVTFVDENVWLAQAQIGQLFNKSKATISGHIKNIFVEGELIQEVVVRKFRTTTRYCAIEGKTQELDADIKRLKKSKNNKE